MFYITIKDVERLKSLLNIYNLYYLEQIKSRLYNERICKTISKKIT